MDMMLERVKYWCHSCPLMFNALQRTNADVACPRCNRTFCEMIEENPATQNERTFVAISHRPEPLLPRGRVRLVARRTFAMNSRGQIRRVNNREEMMRRMMRGRGRGRGRRSDRAMRRALLESFEQQSVYSYPILVDTEVRQQLRRKP
eukprot:TRINITY_DN7808_c0_g4_i1.p1 TRINITY_DN7808_c0_g4~~TRINITY_DN7808_c0_g4_i1.p1  ORF type:complete len:148 (-),score=12.63 TRINITY_DN7808_c0_g4_i1:169-612(-)